MKKLITGIVVVVVVVFIVLAFGPFYTLKEGEQVVVVRFGRIIQVSSEAGLKLKVPFLDRVRRYPKKVLSWDGEAQRLPTEENQFIWVDTT
ncbi:MAG TPA: SPFH domain-containing protein, partial [Spirochaetota bacterium]|nr:SPFH domain-containing protein [Spirochaetota bacterium]